MPMPFPSSVTGFARATFPQGKAFLVSYPSATSKIIIIKNPAMTPRVPE